MKAKTKRTTLAITIPCYNEAKSLSLVLKTIPKKIKGIQKIETIVIDDGSTDKTAKAAKRLGVKHLIIHKRRQGLTKAFQDGLSKALAIGVNIIVNLDGDNQYNPKEIPKLIDPIMKGKTDMVLGNRHVWKLTHMPLTKKFGNLIGSWAIRRLTTAKVQDASTGFRAFTNEVAKAFDLFSGHTYTHETIIQADQKGFRITEIPIQFGARQFGQSKLISSVWGHIKTSSATIVRTILIYKAFKYFTLTGLGIISLGLLGATRFLWFFLTGKGSGHIQSLIFSSILISIGFSTIVMGVLADLVSTNRKLIENLRSSK